MKCKKIITTLMLSTSILGTLTPMVPTLAAENDQVVATTTNQTNQIVNIPDVNLKKALNQKLNQAENATITADQLATIKELDVNNRNIASIEGLQCCTNLTTLKIGNGIGNNDSESNTVSDLTPLKNLTKLTTLVTGSLPIADFSPLKNIPLDLFETNINSNLGNINLTPDENGTVTWKNPFINIDGTAMIPEDLYGGSYDKATNTITWTKEAFQKNCQFSDGNEADGYHHYMNLSVEDFNDSKMLPIFGNVELQTTYYSDGMAAFNTVKSLFKNTDSEYLGFWSIADDLTQEKIDAAKAKVDVLPDDIKIPINAGSYKTKQDLENLIIRAQYFFDRKQETLALFKDHSDDTNTLEDNITREKINQVKTEIEKLHDGETKTYLLNLVNKAQQLFDETHKQQSVEQTIQLGGQELAKVPIAPRVSLTVKGHKATITKNSNYQFHWCGWKTSRYASIKLTDPNGNILYNQQWNGNQQVKGNYGPIASVDLPEGSTVEIYHAEGPWHR
ncbi:MULTISPECIES: toxin Cry1Ac domain D-VI-related protein, partial [unclassified Enterococcus]|uniref:toxin Cry1Ac domain D-VI-related protein n=1 Tax=unclassified Enterococcus TaxID=2608891 RepID=UPI001F14C77D